MIYYYTIQSQAPLALALQPLPCICMLSQLLCVTQTILDTGSITENNRILEDL